MDHARRPRHRALAVVLATLLVPLVVGSAAASNRPTVIVSAAAPTDATVTVTATINRAVKQIASCLYGIDATPTIDCGPDRVGGTKSTTYTINPPGQPTGTHIINVTIRLTDGGGGSGSASFTIDAQRRVFARAWTNVDGVAGYDAATDRLISELVDTDGSNTVSAGDTIRVSEYPTNLEGTAFLPFGISSHTVEGVTFSASFGIQVSSGGARFTWFHAANLESYQEQIDPGSAPSVEITDTFTSDSGICGDVIRVSTSAPSQPAQDVDAEDFDSSECGDRGFIDVELNLP